MTDALWLDTQPGEGSLQGKGHIMSTAIAKSLEEAVERLRRDPEHQVEAVVGDLRVEVRVKTTRSAADLFREVGPWEGEAGEALLLRLADERRRGGSTEPPAL